jgi:hypothetical protein
MRKHWVSFLLLFILVDVVVFLPRPAIAQSSQEYLEISKVEYPTTYTIMPGSLFTIWVTLSWSLLAPRAHFLWVIIRQSASGHTQGDNMFEYKVVPQAFDGKPHSERIQLLKIQAPDQEGVWKLFAQAMIVDQSRSFEFAVSDTAPFSVPIGNPSSTQIITPTTASAVSISTTQQTTTSVVSMETFTAFTTFTTYTTYSATLELPFYTDPNVLVGIVALAIVVAIAATVLMKRRRKSAQTQLDKYVSPHCVVG